MKSPVMRIPRKPRMLVEKATECDIGDGGLSHEPLPPPKD